MLRMFRRIPIANTLVSIFSGEKDIAIGIFLAWNAVTRNLYKSTDLSNWDIVSNGTLLPDLYNTDTGKCIAYGNGIYVALDINNRQIYSSVDGITWILRYSQSGWRGYHVKFLNGKFIVIGKTSDATNTAPIAHSSDGINWTNIGTGTPFSVSNSVYSGSIFDVDYAFGKYIFIGFNAQHNYSPIAISDNLINFTSAIGFSRSMAKATISYDNNKIYVAGYAYGTNINEVISFNGLTLGNRIFLQNATGFNFNLVSNLDDTKLLVGNESTIGIINKSSNAYTGLFPNINPRTICAGNGKLVIGCTGINKFTTDNINWIDVVPPGSSPNLVFCKSN